MVADVISRLKTLGLYQDNGNDDLAKTDDNVVDNIMEQVHATELNTKLSNLQNGGAQLGGIKGRIMAGYLLHKKG